MLIIAALALSQAVKAPMTHHALAFSHGNVVKGLLTHTVNHTHAGTYANERGSLVVSLRFVPNTTLEFV